MQADITSRIRKDLSENADEKTKNSSSRFFKEEVKCLGVRDFYCRKNSKRLF
ncbi:DNA alkylation repair protein [Methanosarcina mazei]|nr:DNA alkylation repair protein [Methanosarcina mazei]